MRLNILAIVGLLSVAPIVTGAPGNKVSEPKFELPKNGKPFQVVLKNGPSIDNVDRAAIKQNDKSMMFIVGNNRTSDVCIFGRTKDLNTGETNFAAIFGNMIFFGPDGHYSGVLFTRVGCKKNCEKCDGEEKPIWTLSEFAYKEKKFWNNLSNVDGISANMTMTTMNSTAECHRPRECHFTLAQAKEVCPPENFWKYGEAFGCMSSANSKEERRTVAVVNLPASSTWSFAQMLTFGRP
ncbi:hypothetical protein BKA65DRAFT_597708 [Rhexocercosporidium sp. MPI-PUGE-AT-0058]|nr:hypothetical protein BKA65DRAFT_597708 [Rhexocercosporidium sp. MPI-PUGE-AT-0058]